MLIGALALAACGAATAQPGDTVSVHYTGKLDDGTEFDTSRDGDPPLSFTVGSGQMIPGFDTAVNGMAVGDAKTVRIEAADAYGERRQDLVFDVPRENVPAEAQVGTILQTATGQAVEVIEITETTVKIDTNHPLAGEALTFDIELVDIQAQEETPDGP